VKLSAYIKELQRLKRQVGDVDVVMSRYSDLTREVDPPQVTQMLSDSAHCDWTMRAHSSMTAEQKAKLVTVVELVGGN
jgi:hypothetical protein